MESIYRHYEYHFVQRFYPESKGFLKYKLLYTFKSSHSHQWYWVWVEVYQNHVYAIKFHLKIHRDSPDKYKIMTGLHEVRPVMNTCIAIMLDMVRRDVCSSFGFIGANMRGENVSNTKRYRFYSNMMATHFGESEFIHFQNEEKSAYLLIRKSELEKNSLLLDTIQDAFAKMYFFF